MNHHILFSLALLLCVTPLAHADLTTGLVAHYPFNGNANDASGNGNNGTVYGATLTADRFGNANSAYSFNGTDNYIDTNLPTIDTTTAHQNTVAFWMYWNGSNEEMPIGFNLYDLWFTRGNFGFNTAQGDVYGINSSALANHWLHVTAVFTNGNVTQNKLYINGVTQFLSQQIGSPVAKSVTPNMRIGNWISTDIWQYYFDGIIDDLRIYNRALSAAEVIELYQENTTQQLTITKTGSGNGTVTSNPAGINCGTDCTENYPSNTAITLTATPMAGSIFSGFSGDADCVDKQVTMNAAKNCIATFNLPPTATTSTAINITQTSATLNGNVTSTGATATATFDFGTTNAYGTSVAAAPAQVYSSTAVAVSANNTGLTCGTMYHYRVKAANSIGTSYGADKTFTTAACNAWLYPVTMNLPRDREFNLNVTAKSDGMYITNYEFLITYDPTKLSLIYNPLCNNYVCPGANALNTNSVYLVGTNAVKIIGLGGQTAANNDLQLLIIKFKTQTTLGITNVELKTNSMVNTSGMNIGLESRGAAINISSGICGDANGDTMVNIVDALAIARKLVGLPPPPTIESLWADVTKDNQVTIADALQIARYSVGLVLPPEVCAIGQAL